jgi:hypothetical protein
VLWHQWALTIVYEEIYESSMGMYCLKNSLYRHDFEEPPPYPPPNPEPEPEPEPEKPPPNPEPEQTQS